MREHGTHETHFMSSVIYVQARALWLVGVCSTDLPVSEWEGALRLVTGHLSAPDLVVSSKFESPVEWPSKSKS